MESTEKTILNREYDQNKFSSSRVTTHNTHKKSPTLHYIKNRQTTVHDLLAKQCKSLFFHHNNVKSKNNSKYFIKIRAKKVTKCTKVLHVNYVSFLTNFNKHFTQSKIFNKTPNTVLKIPQFIHELDLLFPFTSRGNPQHFTPFNTAGV
jgi:hypothetical protein